MLPNCYVSRSKGDARYGSWRELDVPVSAVIGISVLLIVVSVSRGGGSSHEIKSQAKLHSFIFHINVIFNTMMINLFLIFN